MQRQEGLSAQGARLLNKIAERCHSVAVWKDKILWAVVDASFCNQTVFRLLDPKIVLIGRVRKDIRLYGPAPPNASMARAGRGRKASYGPLLPTPEQLRQDDATRWKKCPIFAAGQKHELNYKTIAPVLWRSGAAQRSLRLLVIRPLRYRAHGHTLYRQPAYLLVDNIEVPVAEALQAYFYRWEIEVDQKDEKDLLGGVVRHCGGAPACVSCGCLCGVAGGSDQSLWIEPRRGRRPTSPLAPAQTSDSVKRRAFAGEPANRD